MYRITYDERVQEDVALLSKSNRFQVQKSIENKLALSPEVYGKPLRHSLMGFWSLRVGDHRVVFQIKKETVFILAILHRSIVYKNIDKRM